MSAQIALPSADDSIIREPNGGAFGSPAGFAANLVISVATAADSITPWGVNPRMRDEQLRGYWPTEPYFASTLTTVVDQYAAFSWSLEGPQRTVRIAQDIFSSCEAGNGWEHMITKFLIDAHTQDNGAFLEVVRLEDSPSSPVVTLNHLDSARCLRTGRRDTPVVYVDLYGGMHQLKWYQVISYTDFPAPQEEAWGYGYSTLTRVLRSVQIMRDTGIIKQEKASGRFTRQIHFVSGVSGKFIEDSLKQKQVEADAQGFTKVIQPAIIASLDPTAKISKETIDLASVPDDANDHETFVTYLTVLAMAFGTDYQNLAPLPGRGLGSGSEGKTMNMRSRGKGPGLFMKRMERIFNFHGILPRTVHFEFGEQDIGQQMEETALSKERALEREIRIRSGEITPEVARQIAVDVGDLDERYLVMMRESNATSDVVGADTSPLEPIDPTEVKLGTPAPKEPPQAAPPNAAVPRPPNSNGERNRAPSQDQKRQPGAAPPAGQQA